MLKIRKNKSLKIKDKKRDKKNIQNFQNNEKYLIKSQSVMKINNQKKNFSSSLTHDTEIKEEFDSKNTYENNKQLYQIKRSGHNYIKDNKMTNKIVNNKNKIIIENS